jgi:hypothetical protein
MKSEGYEKDDLIEEWVILTLMKKLLGIMVLGLLWCNASAASSYRFFECEDKYHGSIDIMIMQHDFGYNGFVGSIDTRLEYKDSIYIFTRDDTDIKLSLKFNIKNKNFDGVIKIPDTELFKLKGKCKQRKRNEKLQLK